MNVLVTGGAGYIGSHTCVELIQKGYRPVVVDNLCNASVKSLERVEEITGAAIPFHEGDVRDEALLEQIFGQYKIDCVIHFAGLKAVGESVSMPLTYYDNNLNSTMTLCRVMDRWNVRSIVFSSSATVYSGDNEMPLREDSRTGNCTNPYGWTKYMCEQILRDIAEADPRWSVVLLRYFNPVGAHASGAIGEHPNGTPNNLMPYIAQTAVGKREHLNVFGNDYPTPDGSNIRDYIDVVDLARAHVVAIARLIEGKNKENYEIFNIGTGRAVSVLELVNTFERVNELKLNYKVAPRRPGDVVAIWADTTHANEELGWKAERSLDDTLRSAWAWEKNVRGIK